MCFEVVFPQHLNPELKSYLRLLLDPKIQKEGSIPLLKDLNEQAERWKEEKELQEQQETQIPSGVTVSICNSCVNERKSVNKLPSSLVLMVEKSHKKFKTNRALQKDCCLLFVPHNNCY